MFGLNHALSSKYITFITWQLTIGLILSNDVKASSDHLNIGFNGPFPVDLSLSLVNLDLSLYQQPQLDCFINWHFSPSAKCQISKSVVFAHQQSQSAWKCFLILKMSHFCKNHWVFTWHHLSPSLFSSLGGRHHWPLTVWCVVVYRTDTQTDKVWFYLSPT